MGAALRRAQDGWRFRPHPRPLSRRARGEDAPGADSPAARAAACGRGGSFPARERVGAQLTGVCILPWAPCRNGLPDAACPTPLGLVLGQNPLSPWRERGWGETIAWCFDGLLAMTGAPLSSRRGVGVRGALRNDGGRPSTGSGWARVQDAVHPHPTLSHQGRGGPLTRSG